MGKAAKSEKADQGEKKGKTKRRGHGEGTIFFREDKGLWVTQVTVDGKRRTLYGKTRKEVQDKKASLEATVIKGTYAEPSKTTVGAWMQTWLDTYCKPPMVEDTTQENYQMNVRVHIIPTLGNIPLQKLTTADVQQWVNAKTVGGRADGKPGAMSPRMVHYMHFLLQKALKQARKDGLVARNVAEDVILPKMSKKKKPVFLTMEEVDRFLDAAEGDRLFPALQVEMGTGLRRGELLGLKWEDIDFKKGTATVKRQLVKLKGGSVFHDHAKSEAGERTVTLPDEATEALQFHKRRQDNEKAICGEGYQDNGLVFSQANGRKINPRNFTKHFDKLLEKAGVRHIPFHGTRHTHATELLAAGVNLKTIQKRLGHSSFRVTADFYAHVGEELQKDAAAKANEVLNRRKKKTEVLPKEDGRRQAGK